MSSEPMGIERIPVDYRDKYLELKFGSEGKYLQACRILKNLHASVFFTAPYAYYIGSIAGRVATFPGLSCLIANRQCLMHLRML